ncbi:uncharacterized protein [Drosophila pseudoobscura]|uniref:Uncharacterized protein n=1 Tax=Drosophila pseudoobscura pseudoobscura TaxID=46245 RepID=A0A6I8VH88_DROPS|nr:uncharacterized protein LOC26531966 [Drosophila pseudoobscura]
MNPTPVGIGFGFGRKPPPNNAKMRSRWRPRSRSRSRPSALSVQGGVESDIPHTAAAEPTETFQATVQKHSEDSNHSRIQDQHQHQDQHHQQQHHHHHSKQHSQLTTLAVLLLALVAINHLDSLLPWAPATATRIEGARQRHGSPGNYNNDKNYL